MKVIDVPIKKIKRYWNNPRVNQHAVNAIRRSLDEFGWRQPIVVDKSFVIVVGDTRYQAALARGDKTVPVHIATDMTEAQVKSYRIADNRLNEIADWDDSKLLEEITGLREMETDLSVIGFSQEELAALFAPKEPPKIEDFMVSPSGRTHWVVVHASEEDSALILQAVRKLKLKNIKMAYSGDNEKTAK